MIKKERKVPIRILKCEALLRRLPLNHEKRPLIEEELAKRKAGYKGEKTLDYYLNILPKKDYLIFHDLRLSLDGEHFFQIDTLLLSPRFALIIEVKNISGTSFFERSFKQLIRIGNEGEEGFPDPVSQVKRQQVQLKRWFVSQQIDGIPIEYLIVISNPSTVLKTEPKHSEIYRHVCHVQHLSDKMQMVSERQKTVHLSEKEIKKITRQLLKKHTSHSNDILQTYGIDKSDILPGVYCPSCHSTLMNMISVTWECPECNFHLKAAHNKAILDYFLVYGSTINHQQCSLFLKINSRSIVSKLLKSLDLTAVGKGRGRVYHADAKWLETFAEKVDDIQKM